MQSPKKRILFLCDKKGWAYDTTAKNLKKNLEGKFDFSIKYVHEGDIFNPDEYDLIYVFWWGETYHRRFVDERHLLVKEISSHRWESEESFGNHNPRDAFARYMHDADYLVATSLRLEDLFTGFETKVFHYPLGVDTDIFYVSGPKTGSMRLGWAGNKLDPEKNVNEILISACGDEFPLAIAGGCLPHEKMAEFYNNLDIICIASTTEGTPFPLIEAMACGCFPVCTNVGIVPEVVRNGENGLIVEPSVDAFRTAFNWCRENLEMVRKAGAENAVLIKESRSWEASAEKFEALLTAIFEESNITKNKKEVFHRGTGVNYAEHLARINTGGYSDSAYKSACAYFIEDIEGLLPEGRDSKILDVGPGHGHFLRYLVEKKYRRVFGVDNCKELIVGLRSRLGHKVEKLVVEDIREFFKVDRGKYDCIVMMDVIEHVSQYDAQDILAQIKSVLNPGGKVILRTPNMANLLGGYSLYMDLTHMHGYTEWSLMHLMEKAGFDNVEVHIPRRYATTKRKIFSFFNRLLHKLLYHLNDRAVPKWFGKNVVVWGQVDR